MTGVAVITGGAQRIGSEIARHLHSAGFTIALHYRSSVDQARALAAQLCSQRPDSCHLFQADLESIPELRQLAADLLSQYGELAVLVNNASGFQSTPIHSCTEARFDSMLGSNLKGPYFLIQALLPGLQQAGGCIVNILDVHVERPLHQFNAYCAAKAGLASLTRSLALELGPGVRVNGVAPGAILWPEDDEAYDQATRLETVASTPLKRMGEPGDIARTVKFLACDAPFVTGSIITVDGGRSLTG